MKGRSVFGPQLNKIQLQEKAKRRRNAVRGRKCAKGTTPQVYSHPETIVRKTKAPTWFDRLRARFKTLWPGGKHEKTRP